MKRTDDVRSSRASVSTLRGIRVRGLVLLTLVSAVGTATAQHAPPADSGAAVDAVLAQLLPIAPPPGRKDIESTLEKFKIGPALWDTGEGRGGYNARVAQLATDEASGCPTPSYAALETIGSTLIDRADPNEAGLDVPIFPRLFLEDYSQFTFPGDSNGTLPGDPNDFASALASPSVTFFATQNTVFSPEDAACLGVASASFYDFPYLSSLSTLAQTLDIEFAQNIGLANHPSFPSGYDELSAQYPLISKHAMTPSALLHPSVFPAYDRGHTPAALSELRQYQTNQINWGVVFAGPPSIAFTGPSALPPDFINVPMSMAHPEVAELLEQSIASRVDLNAAFASAVDYSAVGGEFFVRTEARPTADEFFPAPEYDCPDEVVVLPAAYRACLANTDYSDHSYAHFRAWLELRRYAGDFAALSSAWLTGPATATSYIPSTCTSFAGCADLLDPLLDDKPAMAQAAGANLVRIFRDWNAFQRDQFLEAQSFQYRAALEARALDTPADERIDASFYTLQFTPLDTEFGALRSDGVALGNWYAADDAEQRRRDLVSPMKKRALHAVTFGESLNFPLFGMPREPRADPDAPPNFCEVNSQNGVIPDQWRPQCLDFVFSERTLHEFFALGVDSLGIAYWENVGLWSTSNSVFPPVFEALGQTGSTPDSLDDVVFPSGVGASAAQTIRNSEFADFTALNDAIGGFGAGPVSGAGNLNILGFMSRETAAIRSRRAFMTPWRSPLLVHVGDAVVSFGSAPEPYAQPLEPDDGVEGLVDDAIEALAAHQAQFAPFAERTALGDMWLTSERELLLSPFVPDFGPKLLRRYEEAALANALDLLIFTDMETFEEVLASKQIQPGTPSTGGTSNAGPGGAPAGGPVTPSSGPGGFVIETPTPSGGALVQSVRLSGSGGLTWSLWGFHLETPTLKDDVRAFLDLVLYDIVEARTQRLVRPVSVVTSASCGAPTAPEAIDLTVATDGLNFLVTATNTSLDPQSFALQVDAALGAPVRGMIDDGGSTGNGDFCLLGDDDPLDEGLGSEVHFIRADLATPLTIRQIDAALTTANAQVNALTMAEFDTSAAKAVIDELQFIRESLDPNVTRDLDLIESKVVAGLLRLARMPFLAIDDGLSPPRLVVSTLDQMPVAGARVQLEFPLQHHARRDVHPVSGVPLVTNASGRLLLDANLISEFGTQASDDGDGLVWDFVDEAYTRPNLLSTGDVHLVKFEVRHPLYGSQTSTMRHAVP